MLDENQDLAVLETKEISITRTPDIVLAEAKRAAESLKAIIAKKPKPVIIGGKQFLEFEDWAMIAKFYGVVAKVVESKFVEIGSAKGFESTAVAFHVPSGQEISKAFGMCMNDENVSDSKTRNDWTLQRLRSFSQTRACSKALKQVFSWVAVLGGYAPQPAEDVPHETGALAEAELPIKTVAAEIQDLIGVLCGGDQPKMDAQIKEFTSWKDKQTGVEKSLTFADINRLTGNPDKHAWIRKIHSRVQSFVMENKK